ncbi:predicted protein [Histoplasma capsulatum var. duboisii H88]|uniref:Predicted protein n=2 Tax=Ajellomyces capsulatus TaxID=5037 RepID=F0U9Q6_AJEC8|nr:predicted protein [Histoplasma capsulatum H143]EGC41945.1 predicted protein [Histoplasma capsulatum var. duboisii H88]QSS51634.1 hypothetical protein I7I53_07001 [Histoplasma capsulatum var. duboisii H88]
MNTPEANWESWIQTQPLINPDDFNLSPNTLDAIQCELSRDSSILNPSTDISSANQAVAALESRVANLEDRLKSLRSALDDILKYVVGLEPWTKTVTEVLEKLGQRPTSAPPSTTQSNFAMNEGA